MNDTIKTYLQKIQLPQTASHKGQNGKLMIIGGSDLFHAASKWSLDVASKFVDMVFYASVPSNNELIQQAKGEFWNGIVIQREEIENYITEADCILIGPGMTRSTVGQQVSRSFGRDSETQRPRDLLKEDWNNDTEKVVNYLLSKYPTKKWVIDAGALQMIDPSLLNENCIITPHQQEFRTVYRRRIFQLGTFEENGDFNVEFGGESHGWAEYKEEYPLWFEEDIIRCIHEFDNLTKQRREDFESYIRHASKLFLGAVVVLKGKEDFVSQWDGSYHTSPLVRVEGGNPGMTKGGTGDVLAGLIAALYCTHDAITAAVVGSYINKKAGDDLYQTVGPYFNASDLTEQIPKTLWRELQET